MCANELVIDCIFAFCINELFIQAIFYNRMVYLQYRTPYILNYNAGDEDRFYLRCPMDSTPSPLLPHYAKGVLLGVIEARMGAISKPPRNAHPNEPWIIWFRLRACSLWAEQQQFVWKSKNIRFPPFKCVLTQFVIILKAKFVIVMLWQCMVWYWKLSSDAGLIFHCPVTQSFVVVAIPKPRLCQSVFHNWNFPTGKCRGIFQFRINNPSDARKTSNFPFNNNTTFSPQVTSAFNWEKRMRESNTVRESTYTPLHHCVWWIRRMLGKPRKRKIYGTYGAEEYNSILKMYGKLKWWKWNNFPFRTERHNQFSLRLLVEVNGSRFLFMHTNFRIYLFSLR